MAAAPVSARRRSVAVARLGLAAVVAATLPLVVRAPAMAGENVADLGQPASKDAAEQAILRKLEAMEQRIKFLEGQLKQKEAASGTTGSIQQPAADSKTQDGKKAAGPNKASAQAGTPPKGTSDAPPADSANAGQAAGSTLANATANTGTKTGDKAILGLVDSPVPGLSIGAYGEVQFGYMQNPAAGGQWQLGSDAARRLVLLPTYAITDNIIFNAEIEFEHAGPGFDNDDKLHGTAEIEQLWVDFKITDPFNWRAPGIDLVPIGYINQHHEPTEFYSVFRPELYNGLIPSTWKVPATSVYGTIADGVKYQVMLSAAQEDFGDAFDCRTAANTVPPGSGTMPCTRAAPRISPASTALTRWHFPIRRLASFQSALQLAGCLRQGRFHRAGIDPRSRLEHERLLHAQYDAARRA